MRSLTLKLIIAFLFVSLTGIALVAFFSSRIVNVEFGNFVDEQNQTLIAQQLADYYAANGSWQGAHMPNPRFIGGRGPERYPITVTDEAGIVVIPGGGRPRRSQLPPDLIEQGVPIEVDGKVVGYIIEPGELERTQFRSNFSQRVNVTILLAALGAVGVSLILGVLLSRTLTRPLAELTAATEKMSQGELDQEVPVRTNDELGKLAASFNRMSRQLAQAQTVRRRMTADIAHDLRTPLSIILGHAEALRDGALPPEQETFDVMYDEAQRLTRLVEDLRMLTLVEAGELPLVSQPTDPQLLLERAYRAHIPQAQDQDIQLILERTEGMPPISVDPDRMAQVLDNLIANALQFTPAQGQVVLRATTSAAAVYLMVEDTGPGLSAVEVENVFNRFYRGDHARGRKKDGGSGLGLAITKSLVEAQGGRIEVNSEPGHGAAFIITFPFSIILK